MKFYWPDSICISPSISRKKKTNHVFALCNHINSWLYLFAFECQGKRLGSNGKTNFRIFEKPFLI